MIERDCRAALGIDLRVDVVSDPQRSADSSTPMCPNEAPIFWVSRTRNCASGADRARP